MRKKILSAVSIFLFAMLFFFTSQVNAAPAQTKRLWGKDRYQTCSEIVNEGWKTSEYAVIVNGENFPDALSASTLAKKYNAPILLTQDNTLDSNTSYQLKKLGVKKVFIVGGNFVVKPAVENAIHNLGIDTERFFGQDRTETSVAVAKQIGIENGIILTTDSDFTDALTVAPIAAKLQMPIILMPKDSIPSSVSSFIAGKNIPRTYVLGESDLISDSIVTKFPKIERIPGKDKYERNINIINAFNDKFDFKNGYLAYSEKFADALSGSALAALNGNPIVLTGDTVSETTKQFISNKNFSKINVLGGTAGISQSNLDNLLGSTNNNSDKKLKLHYIDVGQGDSILIQTPNGKNMLIDAGTNASTTKLTSYLQNLGITQLDIIAGTHPHEDHIGAMDSVVNMFKVGKIYMPKVTANTKAFENLVVAIKNKGLQVNAPIPGTTIELDSDVKVEVLAPNSDKYNDVNNYSIVFKVTYGNNRFLFTGDAEKLSESEIIQKGYNLSSDVLKIGHHGSTSSTTNEFLNAVNPKYAVISCGKANDYGHPHKETLSKLNSRGIDIYRTDKSGTIVATSDGTNISFNTSPVKVENDENKVNSNTNNVTPTPVPTPAPKPTPAPAPKPQVTDDQSATVYVTKSGGKYHRAGCKYLRKSQRAISKSDAINSGYSSCSVCNP